MRTIIAGSRGVTVYADVEEGVRRSWFNITTVLSGTARGVDKLGEQWAANHGVAVEAYPAQWDLHGRQAGYVRNLEMARRADALVAVWDGESRGTKHMILTAVNLGLKVYVHRVM